MNQTSTLSEVADISLGQTFRGAAESVENTSGIKLLQIKDIKEGELTFTESLGFANLNSSKIFLRKNDILLPLRGSRHEAMIFAGSSSGDVVTTTNQVAIIRVKAEHIGFKYLSWYLNSKLGGSALSSIQSGTSISNINSKKLAKLPVLIPKREVQENIAAVYSNWLQQKQEIALMLINGDRLVERLCDSVLRGDKGDL